MSLPSGRGHGRTAEGGFLVWPDRSAGLGGMRDAGHRGGRSKVRQKQRQGRKQCFREKGRWLIHLQQGCLLPEGLRGGGTKGQRPCREVAATEREAHRAKGR